MTSITSRQNPIVQRYRDAARADAGHVLLLDGLHLIEEALAAQLVIRHVLVAADALQRPETAALIERLRASGVDVASATQSVLEAASPVRSPSGLVALADSPAKESADAYQGPNPLVVIACEVQDPGNLGAIVRVAEAGGASGVVAAGGSANPFSWKSLRGSMGSALRLPIALVPHADDAIAEARRHGCQVVAAVPRSGVSLFDSALLGPVAILVGGEGSGLSPALIRSADTRVTIPMATPVESLNAAITAALIVYEAARQRAGVHGLTVPGRR